MNTFYDMKPLKLTRWEPDCCKMEGDRSFERINVDMGSPVSETLNPKPETRNPKP